MPNPIALCVLLLVALSCLAVIWKKPGEGIGLPLIAVLCFGYLYLEQPLELARRGTLEIFLDGSQGTWLVGAAALMLTCFVWGWCEGRSRIPLVPAISWDPLQLWRFGFAGATLGFLLLGYIVIRSGGVTQAFSAPHGASLNLEGLTAYVFLCPWWMISGLAMMITGNCRMAASAGRTSAVVCIAAILYGFSILASQRGFFFSTTAAILVSRALGRETKPTIMRLAPVWTAAALAVLLIVGYRSVTKLGENFSEVPDVMQALTLGTSDTGRVTGNEFVYAAATLETVSETHKYELGVEWFYTYTVHLIPRIFWPEKPYDFPSPGITWDDIFAVTGIIVAGGAAPTIVAEIYQNFGVFSPLFFFLFGLASGKLFMRAQSGNPLPAVGYAMLAALSLNVFAQQFSTILVFWPYAMAPMFLCHLQGRKSRQKLWDFDSAEDLVPLDDQTCNSMEYR